MLRTRLVRLPVISLSILIGIYKCGVVSAVIAVSVDIAAAELAAEVVSKPPEIKSENGPEGEPSKNSSQGTPTVSSEPNANSKRNPKNSPSILQMLQGYDREILFGATVAVAFFCIGWISGGSYSVRRERRRRTKLRF